MISKNVPSNLGSARRDGKSRKSRALGVLLVLVVFGSFFYFGTGFFVIQPIGALPEGATVWYWRYGTKLPFVCSADGLLLKTQGGVSLLGRAAALAALAETIKERKIASLPYSRTLYLISTKGCEFEQ